jgi:hypothetical protein
MAWTRKDAKQQKRIIESLESHICDTCASGAGIKPASNKKREGHPCYTCGKRIHNGD